MAKTLRSRNDLKARPLEPCDESCPVARTARLIEGKWTTRIVRDLLTGKKRYSELQRSLTGISELCGKIGDGVNQAADLISATASIPSLNFIPLTTFGNWF